MHAVETEVKFRVADQAGLERKLGALGFHCETPPTFERNTLYDTSDRRLRESRQILRIREYGGKWVLTHKQTPPNDSPAARHKQRIETETVVDDGDAVERILAALGYKAAFVYEKWRSEWSDGEGHCVIDQTPLGLYAELEGPSEWIDSTLASLAVPESDTTNLSYGRLFEVWQAETGSPAHNMAFEEIGRSSAEKAER